MIKAVIFDMYETLVTLYASPLYFSRQMAEDAGISEDSFQKIWRPTDELRTVGKMSFEDVLRRILTENGRFSEELLRLIVSRRISARNECFRHMHPEIIPLLNALHESGIRVGLISNCFSEEVISIRGSVLFPFFDAVCLSYEEGLKKPDLEIYKRCMKKLSVSAAECLYVGDGGSDELEAAAALKMNPIQAAWYLKEGTLQPTGRKDGFIQADKPLDLLKYC